MPETQNNDTKPTVKVSINIFCFTEESKTPTVFLCSVKKYDSRTVERELGLDRRETG